MKNFYRWACLLALLAGCASKNEKRAYMMAGGAQDQNVVVTGKARKEMFYREFESNGRLKAVRQAKLPFEKAGMIQSVRVKNGDFVRKGQLIALIDTTVYRRNYESVRRRLESRRLELDDQLIRMGDYRLQDSASVPAQVMKNALLRSGYSDALSDMQEAALGLQKTRIRAPFDGVVADLEAKANNLSGDYKSCCSVIDNRSFDISFPLLESEAFRIRPGVRVAVIPYAFDQDTLYGQLKTVNPKVDEETGMVMASAVVENATGRLAEGMNARVLVRQEAGVHTVLPKSAVTLRQERKVVFVCRNDTAHWRYVRVGEENSRFCTIVGGGVKPGEEVITEGNFNLAHLVPVTKLNQD
ncbi:MAG: efflux RND transporter periplasmic adaptor subunit [Cytophagales bacterium]|nr:efflux RND transporter periplasmic adaptor subunit [Cytophagales bacterium]